MHFCCNEPVLGETPLYSIAYRPVGITLFNDSVLHKCLLLSGVVSNTSRLNTSLPVGASSGLSVKEQRSSPSPPPPAPKTTTLPKSRGRRSAPANSSVSPPGRGTPAKRQRRI